MLGKIFAVLVIISFIFAGISGNMAELGNSAMKGADDAVRLSGSILGVMCLWSGIIRVLDKAGFTAFLTRLIAPLFRIMYPNAYKSGDVINDISADYSANLLGLGNAAMPIGMRVMNGLKDSSGTASDEMIMFAVLNTAPVQLIPATLIAMRNAYGSLNASEIILPIWICSALTFSFGVMLCKFLAKVCKQNA